MVPREFNNSWVSIKFCKHKNIQHLRWCRFKTSINQQKCTYIVQRITNTLKLELRWSKWWDLLTKLPFPWTALTKYRFVYAMHIAHKLESFRSMNSHSSASVYRITKRGFTYSSWNCSDLNGYYWLTAYKMIGIHSIYSDLNVHAQWFLWLVYLSFFDENCNYVFRLKNQTIEKNAS